MYGYNERDRVEIVERKVNPRAVMSNSTRKGTIIDSLKIKIASISIPGLTFDL